LDAFVSAVDEREDLPSVQKLVYLKSCLSGSALNLIKGLPQSAASYEKSMTILRQIYANKFTTSIDQIKKFNNVKLDNTGLEGLRKYFSDIECIIAGMSSLGYEVEGNETAEYFITASLINKLPKAITDSMLRTSGENIVSLAGFRSAINAEMSIQFQNQPSASKPIKSSFRKFSSNQSPRTMGTFSTQTQSVRPKQGQKSRGKFSDCLFCSSSEHSSSRCTEYSHLNHRRNRCRDLGRCWYCLLADHRPEPCHERLACYGCKGPHAVAMCPDRLARKLTFSNETKAN
jgi:hypothetical protein